MSAVMMIAALLCTTAAPRTAWQTCEGGIKKDLLCSVVELENGDLIAAGYSASYGTGDYDGYLVRLDGESGDLVWMKTCGSTLNDRLYDVVLLPDGNCIACGETDREGGNGGSDGWLVTVSPDGEVLREQTHGGALDEVFNSLVTLVDGSIAVAGYTSSAGAGRSDAWVVMFDLLGDLTWERTFGGEMEEQAFCITYAFGRLLVSGTTYSSGEDGNACLWGLEVSGAELFETTWGGPGYDHGRSVTGLTDGSSVVGCWMKCASCMAGFAHIGMDGGLISNERLTSGLDTRVESVALSGNGNILAAGYTEELEFETQEIFVWELSLEPLEIIWTLPLGGSGDDMCLDIIETASGDIVMVGGSNSYGEGDMDALVIRLQRREES